MVTADHHHDHHHHQETHFTASATVRDIVIGMADGLTVPFALAAGLTGAVAASGVIVTAGLAEIAAGSIAMGLGGYLAARTDAEHYASEKIRELRETEEIPHMEEEEVAKVFRGYGLSEQQLAPVVSAICSDKNQWVEFMMRFELGLEEPDPARAGRSAATIAGSYVVGGLIPLAPYICMNSYSPGLIRLGGRDHPGAVCFWLHQRALYWGGPRTRRIADRPGRRTGRRRGLFHRAINQLEIRMLPGVHCEPRIFF